MKVVNYFKESWQELGRVTWPDRRTTMRLTLAVVIFSIVLGVFIGLLDLGFNQVIKRVIIKS